MKKNELKALCLGTNSNHVMLFLEMIKAINNQIHITPTFILPFHDDKLRASLEADNIKYHNIYYSDFENKILTIKLPFVRLVVQEMIHYIKYASVRKKLGGDIFDIFFYNGITLTIGKYLLKFIKKSGAISFLTTYGIGLRNPIYLQRLKNPEWRTYRHNIFFDWILHIERTIHIFSLKSLGLIPWRNYSKLNAGNDYILVKTNWDKKMYSENGIPEDKIVVVGSIWSYKITKMVERIGLRSSTGEIKRMVLVILQPFYGLERKLGAEEINYFKNIQKLLDSLVHNKNKKFNVVVKFHPRDDLDLYKDLKLRFGGKVEWVEHNERDTHELIYYSDLMIVQSSTVILDALFMKKRLLFYKLANMQDPFFDYPDLFDSFYTYDVNKSIDDNLIYAERMHVIEEEYNKREEPIYFENEFADFIMKITR